MTLEEWLDKYSGIVDKDHRCEFVTRVRVYVFNARLRDKTAQEKKELSKTYNERADKVLNLTKKLIVELERAPTLRGELLIEKLKEVTLIPSTYVYNPPKIKADIEDIDIFLKAYKLDGKPRNELLNLI